MICTPDTVEDFDSDQSHGFRQWPIPMGHSFLLLGLLLLGGCISPSTESLVRSTVPTSRAVPPPSEKFPASEKTASTPPAQHSPTTRKFPSKSVAPRQSGTAEPAPAAPPPPDLWERLRGHFRLQDIEHPRIADEVERLRRHPAALRALFARATPYLHYIVSEVEQRDMPGEIALLPMVESGFRPRAYSPNGAAGLWQFMPGTAHMLGLRIDRDYDGRRDILAATGAALRYLASLHLQLDEDWLHALAAYNCGIGTMRKALRRATREKRSTRYWELELPGETDAYVPRLLAIARIVADPAAFGITLPPLPDRPRFATVTIDAPLDLALAAELAEVPLDDFLRLNPAYPRGVTPASRPATLLIPIERRQRFEQALAALPKRQWRRWAEHRIEPGDSLIRIAHRYQVSVAAIRQANHLKGHLIRAGRTLRIPLAGQASDRRQGIASRHGPRIRYRVRKGDSLYTIARKFQVSIRDLKRWNKVGRYIRPGQRLTVYPGG